MFLFPVLIKGMREGGESKISLCYPSGVGASPQLFRKQAGFSVCGVFVNDEANGGCF